MDMKGFFAALGTGFAGAYDMTRLKTAVVHLAIGLGGYFLLAWLGAQVGEKWAVIAGAILGNLVFFACLYRAAYLLFFMIMRGKDYTAAATAFKDQAKTVYGVPLAFFALFLAEGLLLWGLSEVPNPTGRLLSTLFLVPIVVVNAVVLWFGLLGGLHYLPLAIDTKGDVPTVLGELVALVKRHTLPLLALSVIGFGLLFIAAYLLSVCGILGTTAPVNVGGELANPFARLAAGGMAIGAALQIFAPAWSLQLVTSGEAVNVIFGVLLFPVVTGALALFLGFLLNLAVGVGAAVYGNVRER